jgi:hypothetical protein
MKLQGCTVIGTAADYKATLLLIEYREGDKILKLGVRCYEGSRDLQDSLRGLERGEIIDVIGTLSSRESKGKWYAAFEGQSLKVVRGVDRSETQVDEDGEPAF